MLAGADAVGRSLTRGSGGEQRSPSWRAANEASRPGDACSIVTMLVNAEQPALLHALTFQLVSVYSPKKALLGAISKDWASSGAFIATNSS